MRTLLDDNCPAARIGELGNQVHNLGCDYQNDEDLSDELGQVAVTLWDIAKKAAIRPVEAWQPEVGEVCECDWAGTGCFSAAIVKYAGSSIIIVSCGGSELIVFVEDAAEQLRPVRTRAQTEREELILDIKKDLELLGINDVHEILGISLFNKGYRMER